MEGLAKLKYIRQSPYKIRFVADLIRGKNVFQATNILSLNNKKASKFILKTINSAIANIDNSNDSSIEPENAFIKEIYVDSGPTIKRMRARAQGRSAMIKKRTSHLTVLVEYKK